MAFRRIQHSLSLLAFVFCLLLPTVADEVEVEKSSTRKVHCMGQTWTLPVHDTTDEGVVMIRADHQVLLSVARALGKNLHWSVAETALHGEHGVSVALGQRQMTAHGRTVTLPLAPQLVSGAVHIPSSALEGLLECRVTVRDQTMYVEPVLQSLDFRDEGSRSTDFVARTSVPVRKKVFELSNPPRTVVDLVGVAMPEGMEESVSHPVLGEVRIGQFQLAPSITRIVLPGGSGVKVRKDRTLDLFEHQLSISWPAGTTTLAHGTPERAPVVKIPPTRMPDRKGPPPRISAPKPEFRPAPPSSREPRDDSSGRPTLSAVAWEGSRLKLTFSEPVSYRWSRVNTGTKRYVIDFPGVVFPQRRQHLSSSVPGVQAVRVVQNMPEPQPIVRLVCDLESPVVVDARGADERVLFLEFPGRKVSASEMPRGMGHTSKKVVAGSAHGRTVCIDAGHGGSDPGALNRSVGINEKTVTLDIALKLAHYLKAQGWNVIMTRTSDRDVSWAGSSAKQELGARANMANEFGADLFVSVHANASVNSDINGTSIHWYKSSDYRLASLMEDGVISATGRKNRGLVKNRFYVLAHTEMPAVLIETAFLTNGTEGKLLADPGYRDRIARGIAAGLQVYAARTFTSTAAKK